MTTVTFARRARPWWLFGFASLLVLLGALRNAYVARIPERRNQAMVRAVAAGDLVSVRHYLAEGADPNTVFRYLDEPMESRGYSPQALWIRIRGGPGAPMMRNGPTALMRAVESGNPQIVRLLLEHGADVNKRGYYGYTALSEAKDGMLEAKDKHAVEILRMLKRAGAKQ